MQQAPRPGYATIPEPTTDVDGLYRSVQALKQAVEQIVGTRGRLGNTAAAELLGVERKASIHVHTSAPPPAPDGDFWLCKGAETTSLSISINGAWLVIWP